MIIENMSPQAIFREMNSDAKNMLEWAGNLIGAELRHHGSIFGRHLWDHFCLIKTYINNGLLSNVQRQRLDTFIKQTQIPSGATLCQDVPELQESPHKRLKYLPPLHQ